MSSDVPQGTAPGSKDNLFIMSDVLKLAKKVFTVGVVVTTIVWSLGVAALVPGVANAATCPTLAVGDNIKVVGSPAIYAIKYNGTKSRLEAMPIYVGLAMKSWYSDSLTGFSYKGKYVSVTEACFNTIPGPDMQPMFVNFRPGSYVVQRESSSLLYAVLPGNRAMEITDQAAKVLYGTNYQKQVLGLQAFASLTVVSGKIEGATPVAHEGMLVKKDGKTWYVDAGNVLREVTSTGMTANRFNTLYARTYPASATTGFTTGTALTAKDATIADLTQTGGTSGPVATGNVNVTLAANTPSAQPIPQDATGVEFLKFNVTGSGTLNDLVVHRIGLGSYNDLSAVYLYEGNTRLTSGRTVSADSNRVIFSNLNLALSGSSRTLTVVADLDATLAVSGDADGFEVVEANGTTVAGVVGGIMSVGASEVSTVIIDNSGTGGSFRLGGSEVEVARGLIDAGSATNDVKLTRLTLTNTGSLSNEYISNLKLVVGGTTLATASSLTGDKVIFNLVSPLTITKGDSKTFTVYADNTGGRVDDDIKFYVDETSDVGILDAQYNFGAKLTNNWAVGSEDYNVTGGEITLASNGPAASNIGVNVTNVAVQNFSFSSSNAVTVRNTKVWVYLQNGSGTAVTTTSELDKIKNVKIVDLDKNNQTVVGPQAAFGTGTTVSGDGAYKVFTDNFDIAAGQTRRFAVLVDIDSTLTSGYKLYTVVDFSGSNYVKYANNSQYVTASNIVPNTLTGNLMTATGATLAVTRTTPPATTNVVKGSTGVGALGLLLTPGTSDDLKITSLKLRVFASSTVISGSCASSGCDTAANAVINTVSLYEEGATTPIATKNLSDLSGTVGAGGYYYVTFNNLSYKLTAGTPKKLVAKVNVKDSTGAAWVMLDIDPDDDIDVETWNNGRTVTESSTSQINTSSPVLVVVGTAGTITVSVDGNTPTSGVVLSGAKNVAMTTYRFYPTKENFTLTGASIVVGANDDDNIKKVMVTYNNKLGTAVTKECYLSGTSCTFTDGQLDAYFPVNQYSLVTLSADFATIDDGADSGDTVQLGFAKTSQQFSTSTNLTNDFILLGEGSNSKLYGLTNTIAVDDSTVGTKTVRKTNVVVAESDEAGTSHTTKVLDPVGVFTFTSQAEPGSNQNSTLQSVTVQLTGNLIAGSAGVNTTTVSVYSDSVETANLMGSGILTGVDTGTSTALEIALTAKNEWTGAKKIFVVVDTTASEFTDASANTEKLTTTLSTFKWSDGSATGITPVSGVPVYSDTYSY